MALFTVRHVKILSLKSMYQTRPGQQNKVHWQGSKDLLLSLAISPNTSGPSRTLPVRSPSKNKHNSDSKKAIFFLRSCVHNGTCFKGSFLGTTCIHCIYDSASFPPPVNVGESVL